MKRILKKLSVFGILFFAFFQPTHSKAAVKGDVTTRVNKIRNTLQEKITKGDVKELTGKDFYTNGKLDEWVNWGNWGNWNNWNNWANWDNWKNWNNWGNWRNY